MSGAAEPSAAGRMRGMAAAIAAISIFAFSLSLSLPLFSILLERMGASAFLIGLSGASAAVAILVGGPVLPMALRHVSLPALMIGASLVMAGLLLVFPLAPDVHVWIALRFVFGFGAATLFFASELWIVSAAPPERRGLAIGVYGLFLSLGFLAGPVLLRTIGTEGWAPFLAGSAICLLAIPPVLIAWRDRPDTSESGGGGASPAQVIRFFRTDPAVLWAVALFGLIETGAMGLLPVWGLRLGEDERWALTLVALVAAGNVLMQVPMGWIGDRFDRRRLLGLCASASLVAAVALPALSATAWPLWIATALWGGITVGLYTFALNEIGARYSGADLARGTAAFMSAYGLGSLASPPLLGAALDAFPPHGLFWLLALGAGAYLALLAIRKRRR